MKNSLESKIATAHANMVAARDAYVKAANELKPGNLKQAIGLTVLGYRLDSAEMKLKVLRRKLTELKKIELAEALGILLA